MPEEAAAGGHLSRRVSSKRSLDHKLLGGFKLKIKNHRENQKNWTQDFLMSYEGMRREAKINKNGTILGITHFVRVDLGQHISGHFSWLLYVFGTFARESEGNGTL